MNGHRLAGSFADDGSKALIDGMLVEGWRAAIAFQSKENEPVPEETHFVAEPSGHGHCVEQDVTMVMEEGNLPR